MRFTSFSLIWLFLAQAVSSGAGEKAVDFNRDIRPILSDKCFFCHGPDSHERKADLRLDTPDGAKSAIVAGDLEASEFFYRITTDDPDDLMPPEDSHKKLTGEEVALLTRWIEEGAAYAAPWAYVPPVKHSPPPVKDAAWPANWVDHFVLARLDEETLEPSPPADPVTLVRRLHFDLTGLPPTPERVDSFLADVEKDPESAWTGLVDELLASPHFGERLAIYWLDLVRFADTVGYHGDQDHNISPYRDYVIRAFNRNLPFDRFTREQIAGDLLPESGKWQKVASGYNRLLQTSHEGGIQAKEYNAIYNADRIRNVSEVWMGATVGCAQCHDHKYDPFTIRDHYALGAFFADIHDDGFNGNTLPANRQPEMMFYPDEVEKRIAELTAERNAIFPDRAGIRVADLEAKIAKLESEIKKGKDRKRKEELGKEKIAAEAALLALVPEEERERWKEIEKSLAAGAEAGRYTMVTEAKPPRTMRVLPRGNWQDDSGEVVDPAVPAFLGEIGKPEGEKADRLDLADWLVDPANGSGGLTARVMANRFWYLFFGTGISRSLSDFGGQGEPPANPELLDSLAVAFYESGWDVKQMVRLLVTSRAYRQSSIASPGLLERDPHNQLVARQSRYRLPAELMRDNALAVSGLLVDEIGGASVKPYQPAGYFRHLNFPTRTYQQHDDKRQWRRGLYVHWQRMFLHPMMKAMDAPSREECTAERPRSNTPNAALVLLNDPTFVEAARVFAQEVIGAESEARLRIDWAFAKALSRSPDEEELRALENLLAKTGGEYRSNPEEAAKFLENGIAPVPEDVDPVELASWTAVTRAILNLNETMTRN
ncbi:MAG: PSD1 and planctomycete cytochrome C domain-containing protein [Verrucomicrobiales bacterium]|nr:PSD1 and planctomycete cytochrome C domain-containing protein [Verrucomicrobiales bacterium]